MKQAPLPVEALLQRFRNNECTPEEIELLQQWLTQLDLSDASTELSPEQLDAVKNRMYQQVTGAPAVIPERHRLPFRQLLVAASWLVLAVSVIVLWYFTRTASIPSQAQKPQLTIIENNHPGIR